MDHSTRKDALLGTSENTPSLAGPLAEATSRILSFLSHSQLRQQLECQVRYFLAGKLLNFTGYGELSGEYEVAPQTSPSKILVGNFSLRPFGTVSMTLEGQPRLKNSLAFKATVSIVLAWLNTHGLVHTAGVLCPEAAMRDTDVLSEDECVTVLHLPEALLTSLQASTASETHWSLLDHLVAAAAQNNTHIKAPRASRSPRSCNSAADAGELRKASVGAEVSRSQRIPRNFCEVGSAQGTCFRYAPVARALTGGAFKRASSRKLFHEPRCTSIRPSRPNLVACVGKPNCSNTIQLWQEEARTHFHLLEAHLRGIELRASSEKLLVANLETRQAIGQRLASFEYEHRQRIRRLQKSLDQATEIRKGVIGESMRQAQLVIREARRRLRLLIRRQKRAEEGLASRARDVTEREQRVFEKEARLLRYGLPKMVWENAVGQCEEHNELPQSSGSPPLQLLRANQQTDMLDGQLHGCSVSYGKYSESQLNGEHGAGKEPFALVHQSPSHTHSPEKSSIEQPAARILKEYECRVMRLTEKLQRSSDQIRNKEAEFTLLVAELESARQKNAEAQKRIKRMQRRYEAARSLCAQQKYLATSLLIPRNSEGLDVEPTLDASPQNLTDASEERDGLLKIKAMHSDVTWNGKTGTDACLVLQNSGLDAAEETLQYKAIRPCGDSDAVEIFMDFHGCPCNAASQSLEVTKSQPDRATAKADLAECMPQGLFHSCRCHASVKQALGYPCRKQCCCSSRLHDGVIKTADTTQGIISSPLSLNKYEIASQMPTKAVHSCCSSLKGCPPTLDPSHIKVQSATPADGVGGGMHSCDDTHHCRAPASASCTVSPSKSPMRSQESLCKSTSLLSHTGSASEETPQIAGQCQMTKGSCSMEDGDRASLSPSSVSGEDNRGTSQSRVTKENVPSTRAVSPRFFDRSTACRVTGSGGRKPCSIGCGKVLSPVGDVLRSQDATASSNSQRCVTIRTAQRVSPESKIISVIPVEENSMYPANKTNSMHVTQDTMSTKYTSATPVIASGTTQHSAVKTPTPPIESPLRVGLNSCVGRTTKACVPSGSSPVAASVQSISCAPVGIDSQTSVQHSQLALSEREEQVPLSPEQSPWGEASIASSLPGSPEVLSNYPSFACPVAATPEGAVALNSSDMCPGGCPTVLGRQAALDDSANSFSPSEHDWLACDTTPLPHSAMHSPKGPASVPYWQLGDETWQMEE
ncbi:hypothetical protein cyc_08531 [Cyclospora cayetanensis]|uniref:Uncharacterized protein n=1 Tax=Cyclospora cayetanensis TaxID=88456 RepID=A0A1D3D5C1_9EIME|nr:hypothetical protein cyc_08531 [Cyclospora cayetanensis]